MIETKDNSLRADAVDTKPLDSYLRFGGTAEPDPDVVDYRGIRGYLGDLGFGDSGLTQARSGRDTKDGYDSYQSPGTHYCDFCGRPMAGAEFDRLRDGRERCNVCSQSLLRRIDDYEELFSVVKRNMVQRFGIDFPKPVRVRVVSQKRLAREVGSAFMPTSGFDARTVGFAGERKDGLVMFFENGSPRLPLMATSAHELTHIWQFTHWDMGSLQAKYGDRFLVLAEGMAKWVEIQYLYLINETNYANRSLANEIQRNDEYGEGLRLYLSRYPLSQGIVMIGKTPFMYPKDPLLA